MLQDSVKKTSTKPIRSKKITTAVLREKVLIKVNSWQRGGGRGQFLRKSIMAAALNMHVLSFFAFCRIPK